MSKCGLLCPRLILLIYRQNSRRSPRCLSILLLMLNSLSTLLVGFLRCIILLQRINEPVDLLSGGCLDSLAVLKSADVLLAAALTDPLSVVFSQVLQGQILVLLAASLKESFEGFEIVLAEELLDLAVGGDLSDFV